MNSSEQKQTIKKDNIFLTCQNGKFFMPSQEEVVLHDGVSYVFDEDCCYGIYVVPEKSRWERLVEWFKHL